MPISLCLLQQRQYRRNGCTNTRTINFIQVYHLLFRIFSGFSKNRGYAYTTQNVYTKGLNNRTVTCKKQEELVYREQQKDILATNQISRKHSLLNHYK